MIILIFIHYHHHYYQWLSSSLLSLFIIIPTITEKNGQACSWEHNEPRSRCKSSICSGTCALQYSRTIFFNILHYPSIILQYPTIFTKSYIITCSFMSYILCADRASAVGYILPPPISSPHIFFNILHYSTRWFF